ncbi:hypothetical protein DFR70_12864 [Nocardia tenerifensis]|uniref:Phage integrase family protein n=1 Tax=Nocardia tenerifensis TaxID=228006 RepID=A0A318KAF9_9NOCA|nr:hypothetical protein [Nocardia tenerifensis]PXX53351.1 hypothetical protein DFR70_12864 [Nocardia tenerifensis]
MPNAQDVILRIRDGSPLPDFRLSDLRDTVTTHITAVTGDPERASAQLGHTDGNISIAQKYYIGADAKRLVVVDNAEHLELLNPLKMGNTRESGAGSPD